MEQTINQKQITKLHAMLHDAGELEHKRQLIWEVTHGRTTSCKELTQAETEMLINYLQRVSGKDRMRRKIFALAYSAGIIYGDTPEDKKMNAAKLNKFVLERGAVKKEISKMSKDELTKTIRQFEAIVKHVGESSAAKEVNSLLSELNLDVK